MDIFRAQHHRRERAFADRGGDRATSGKIEAMVNMLRPYGIKEMVRTGRVAMARGSRPSHPWRDRVRAGGLRMSAGWTRDLSAAA